MIGLLSYRIGHAVHSVQLIMYTKALFFPAWLCLIFHFDTCDTLRSFSCQEEAAMCKFRLYVENKLFLRACMDADGFSVYIQILFIVITIVAVLF